MRLAIIIPAYNEETVIAEVISKLPTKITGVREVEIVIVNDGSTDKTGEIIDGLNTSITALHLLINSGLGGAISTGLAYVKRSGHDIAVTYDADGQHRPEDLIKLVKALVVKKGDFIVGSRLINSKGMPWYRIFGNHGLNWITLLLFGVKTTDSQSGLRGFSRKAIEKMNIEVERMEVSSIFFSEVAKHKLKYKEVPIKAIYTEYSLGKGQKNANAFPLIVKLLWNKFSR